MKQLYLVIADLDGGHVFDRAIKDMDRETTIRDIAAGQFFSKIKQVIEIGTGKDVTDEFAFSVCQSWADRGETLTADEYEFVEMHCGFAAARAFLKVEEAA